MPQGSSVSPLDGVIVRHLRINAATSSPDDDRDGVHIERAPSALAPSLLLCTERKRDFERAGNVYVRRAGFARQGTG